MLSHGAVAVVRQAVAVVRQAGLQVQTQSALTKHLRFGVAQRKHRSAVAMTHQREFISRGSRFLDEAPVTVLSWNILADQFAGRQFDSACPPEHLAWSSRLPRIVEQLLNYDADVICLQEVCRFSW